MKRIGKASPAVLVAVASAAGVAALAATGPSGSEAIKARQAAMEDVGKAMKALAAMAKGEAPFAAGVVHENAGVIADRLAKVEELFPSGSDKGDVETWAKAEIWTDQADFQRQRAAARDAALALASVTQADAYRPALGQLGQGCKGCHDKYRRPKS